MASNFLIYSLAPKSVQNVAKASCSLGVNYPVCLLITYLVYSINYLVSIYSGEKTFHICPVHMKHSISLTVSILSSTGASRPGHCPGIILVNCCYCLWKLIAALLHTSPATLKPPLLSSRAKLPLCMALSAPLPLSSSVSFLSLWLSYELNVYC